MLRTFILFFLFCLAPHAVQSATTAAMGPKLYVPENTFEFEPVLEGVEVVHDFILYNHGDTALNILDIKAG